MFKFMMKGEFISMTKDFEWLTYKAHVLATLFGYELVISGGTFNFYNSPDFRSFKFHVDPGTFTTYSVELFLYKKFEGRKIQWTDSI